MKFSKLKITRTIVSYRFSGIFLRLYLISIYGDYIVNNIVKSTILVNKKCCNFLLTSIFKNDIVEFRFFSSNSIYKPLFSFIHVVYEENNFLIINKKKNMVVFTKNNHIKSLLNILLYLYPQLYCIPNCGFIHRIDSCTTGLLLIAKTMYSFHLLSRKFLFQKIIRVYNTIVLGSVRDNGIVNVPLQYKKKNIFVTPNFFGKYSVSCYCVKKLYKNITFLNIYLGSGRKHQIRAHLNYVGYPILGEQVYVSHEFFNFKLHYFFSETFLHARQVIFLHISFYRFFSFCIRINYVYKQFTYNE